MLTQHFFQLAHSHLQETTTGSSSVAKGNNTNSCSSEIPESMGSSNDGSDLSEDFGALAPSLSIQVSTSDTSVEI